MPKPVPPPPKIEICPECEANIAVEEHLPGCSDQPDYDCIACKDTGLNSKGGPCIPCQTNGRIDTKGAFE